MSFRVGISCCISYSIVIYLLHGFMDQLPLLGKRKLVFLLLFTHNLWFLLGRGFSSSWYVEWAMLFNCGIPWTFHLLFYMHRRRSGLVVRVLESASRGRMFDPYLGHCIVSLSKTYLLAKSTGNTQKRWFRPNMTGKLFTGRLSIKSISQHTCTPITAHSAGSFFNLQSWLQIT